MPTAATHMPIPAFVDEDDLVVVDCQFYSIRVPIHTYMKFRLPEKVGVYAQMQAYIEASLNRCVRVIAHAAYNMVGE